MVGWVLQDLEELRSGNDAVVLEEREDGSRLEVAGEFFRRDDPCPGGAARARSERLAPLQHQDRVVKDRFDVAAPAAEGHRGSVAVGERPGPASTVGRGQIELEAEDQGGRHSAGHYGLDGGRASTTVEALGHDVSRCVGMPRETPRMLGDDLVDAYRVFIAEINDRLAAEGFPDLPQAATTVLRDMDGRGSFVADLAAQAGLSLTMMRSIIADLESGGYVEVDGDRVRPAARGNEAFDAGRRALAAAEERLEHRIGAERLATFRYVLRELAAENPLADSR